MLRRTRTLTRSLAAVTLGAVLAPAAANASILNHLPHLRFHQTQDSRVTVMVLNRAIWLRDVLVAGNMYTVRPDRALSITAPVGTPVYAGSKAGMHRAGDLLFTVSRENTTVNLD